MNCDDVFTYVEGDVHTPYGREDVHRGVLAALSWLDGHAVAGYVAVDLPNCPEFLWMLLACAQAQVPLVALNHRLTKEGKALRLAQLQGDAGPVVVFDENEAASLRQACSAAPSPTTDTRPLSDHSLPGGKGPSTHKDPIDLLRQTPQDKTALVLFTSGTTGTPKAAALTWGQMLASAQAANESLACDNATVWQAALPLYHVGGLQVVLRSWLARRPFLLYRRFDAPVILDDAASYAVTHASVVDKMLQDLLAADAHRPQPLLNTYHCLLLGGAAPNRQTLRVAMHTGACVYASYGMTETCSQIANVLVDDAFDGGAPLMPHAEARILNPDEQGIGDLAVRGPSVIYGYLNAPLPRTSDGFFITGDRASLCNGRLYLHARTGDLIISGGENVYPAEIERLINQIPGVRNSYVFGVPDDAWGQRPVALVESPYDPETVCQNAQNSVNQALPAFSRPQAIAVVPHIPLQSIGKIDRAAAQKLFYETTR